MFVGKMKTESLREDVRKGTWQTSDPWARKRGSAFPGADWGFGGVLTGDGYPKGRKSGTLSWSGNAVGLFSYLFSVSPPVSSEAGTCVTPR